MSEIPGTGARRGREGTGRRGDATRRILNLLFSLCVAAGPLTTDQIVDDPEIGYASPERASRIKAFNRDRAVLANHGVFVREARVSGSAKNEQRCWEIDRFATYADRTRAAASDAADAVAVIDQIFALHADDPARWPLQMARTKLCALAGIDPQSPKGSPHGADRGLTLLWRAFARRRPAFFTYRDAMGRASARTVEIYGMFEQGPFVYLVGRDRAAGGMRTFRADRIEGVRPSPAAAGPYLIPREFDVADFRFLPFDFSERDPVRARFLLPEGATRFEVELLTKGRGSVGPGGGGARIWDVDVRDLEAAARFALENASMGLRALEPPELLDEIARRKRKAVAEHGADE